MRSESVRLFFTFDHRCGYFPERTARNLVIDPLAPNLGELYDHALERGFRRAGGHVYRPYCARCQACVASRIPVAEFSPNRSQRRALERNTDLVESVVAAEFDAEFFALYCRYLTVRHKDGGMDDPNPEDFTRFLVGKWSDTRFIAWRYEQRLVAVAVTDYTAHGLSAVYTFFDPELAERSLGTYAILRQIELARALGRPYLYLGYWIAGHPKMDYKRRFAPLEVLQNGRWTRRSEGA